jgi:hypothetical protein
MQHATIERRRTVDVPHQVVVPAPFAQPLNLAGARSSVFDVPPKFDVQQLARECDSEAAGDERKALELFEKRFRERGGEAFTEFAESAITARCLETLRLARHAERAAIIARSRELPKATAKRTAADRMSSYAELWYGWPITGGLRLRDAKRGDLIAAADKYLGDAKIYTARGNWLAAIAQAMPDDLARVSDVMTAERVAELARAHEVVARSSEE